MAEGGDSWSIGDWHIPTVIAVAIWSASALAVLSYTVRAYVKTSSGDDTLDASPPGAGPVDELDWSGAGPQGPVGAPIPQNWQGAGPQGPVSGPAGPKGPIQRNKFIPSPDAPFGK